MTGVTVALSTVADGNMYNRQDIKNPIILKNRETFLAKHGITLAQSIRVRVTYNRENYCTYETVQANQDGTPFKDQQAPIADGIVTTDKNVALFLPLGDCIGTVLYDPDHDVLMMSHLGRHSLEQQGALRSVEHLVKTYGSQPERLKLWLAPAPSKDAYPIWALGNKSMKEATHEQLAAAGIRKENINDNTAETDKDLRYYSYTEFFNGRRIEDGRHMIVAMMTD
jgi:copper oxidase (laccase) domain-containing protein